MANRIFYFLGGYFLDFYIYSRNTCLFLFRYCVSISGKISAEANLCDTGSAADPHSLGLQDALVAAVCLEPWRVRSDSMGPIGSHRKSGRFLEVHVVFTQK